MLVGYLFNPILPARAGEAARVIALSRRSGKLPGRGPRDGRRRAGARRPLIADPSLRRIAVPARGFLSAKRWFWLPCSPCPSLSSWWLSRVVFSAWALLAGFDIDVGFTGALLVVIATNLALVLPSAPAGVGPFEAGTVVALSYGIDQSDALSYALAYHALNLLPFLLIGYVALQRHAAGVRRRIVNPS